MCGQSSSFLETDPARRQAQNPQIGAVRIAVHLLRELGPVGVDDLSGYDVDGMAQLRHRDGGLFDIDELPAEIGVLCPVAVVSIKVPLRVQKRDMHSFPQLPVFRCGHILRQTVKRSRVFACSSARSNGVFALLIPLCILGRGTSWSQWSQPEGKE